MTLLNTACALQAHAQWIANGPVKTSVLHHSNHLPEILLLASALCKFSPTPTDLFTIFILLQHHNRMAQIAQAPSIPLSIHVGIKTHEF